MDVRTTRRLAAALTLCVLIVAGGAALAAGKPSEERGDAAAPTVLVFGLGSRCRYCVQLKQEIAKVTQVTGDAVRFEDYRVDRDRDMVQRYRVLLSPTLVFLDASGSEVFRHQGLMDAGQIREKLVALKLWGRKG